MLKRDKQITEKLSREALFWSLTSITNVPYKTRLTMESLIDMNG